MVGLLGLVARTPMVPPALAAFCEQLTMLGLLIVAILSWQLMGAVNRSHNESGQGRSGWLVAMTGLARVALAGFAASALVGLVGYVNLAWEILAHIGWFVLMAGSLLVAIRVAKGIAAAIEAKVNLHRPQTAALWVRAVIVPGYWLCVLALSLVAGYALFAFGGWDSAMLAAQASLNYLGISDADILTFWRSEIGNRIGGALVQILIAMFVAYVIWELAKRAMEPFMPDEKQNDAGPSDDAGGTGASRISTLIPLLRRFLLITLVTITAMVVLSALGIDIGPLLAGAGVVGIAIGFGSQTLVRDVVSGVFFLMDDALRMGEYVEIDNIRGTVENISVRSLQLRHHNGPVHTIPFGEIRHLTNYSRDWAIMKFELRVPFETDINKVRKIIKQVGREMAEDPEYGPMMLQPLKSQGVNRMDDSALIVRCKFTALPGEQFVLRREAYTRIQKAFENADIQFAPRRVIVEAAGPITPTQALQAAAAGGAMDSNDLANNPQGDGDDRG